MSVYERENFYDAIIVGAGPAGASAGARLAMNGRKILLVEAKKFPRHKLCGEFISPECLPHFQALGVESQMLAAGGTRICETRFYSANGTICKVPSEWFGTSRESFALGLSRAEMDAQLLKRARAVGVDVREETQAVNLVRDGETIRGVILRARDGSLSSARSRVTIDATGRARSLVRRLDGAKDATKKRASLVAFKAHLAASDDEYENRELENLCEIYFYKGGYGGLNGIENGKRNLCFIARAEDVKRCGGDAERVLREIVFNNQRARKVLQDARIVSSWLCVAIENFGRHTLAPTHGLITIGDAAAFIDPFTGSGMLMALDSGATAARVVDEWLSSEANFDVLAKDYEADYSRQFAGRLRVCSYLRRAAFAPAPLIEATMRALNLNANLRRRLARATRQSVHLPHRAF